MSQIPIGRQYNKLYFEGAHTLAGQVATRNTNLDLRLHFPQKKNKLPVYSIFICLQNTALRF
jgi:hypothetical protein